MRKEYHPAAVATILLLFWSTTGWTQQCKQFVHYDGRTFNVTGAQFPHVSLSGLATERKQVQPAAELTQQLDLIQYNDCILAKSLDRDSELYSKARVGMIQANQQLMQQLVVLQAYAANSSDANEKKLVKQSSGALTKAGQIQMISADSTQGLVSIVSRFPGAPEALEQQSLKQPESPRDMLKNLYSDEDRRVVRDQLSKMIGAMAQQTGAEKSDFVAFVFVPGGDGNLYVPPGMVFDPGDSNHTNDDIRIPYWYGVVGVVFEDNSDTPACVDLTSKVEFQAGQEGTDTRKARMLLLPPKYNRVNEKFILGVPITDEGDQRIGVLTLSVSMSANNIRGEKDLCGAYSRIPSVDAQTTNSKIAERLEYPGRPPEQVASVGSNK